MRYRPLGSNSTLRGKLKQERLPAGVRWKEQVSGMKQFSLLLGHRLGFCVLVLPTACLSWPPRDRAYIISHARCWWLYRSIASSKGLTLATDSRDPETLASRTHYSCQGCQLIRSDPVHRLPHNWLPARLPLLKDPTLPHPPVRPGHDQRRGTGNMSASQGSSPTPPNSTKPRDVMRAQRLGPTLRASSLLERE